MMVLDLTSQFDTCFSVARDAFVRTNRRAIGVTFVTVRPSVCLSVSEGRALWS